MNFSRANLFHYKSRAALTLAFGISIIRPNIRTPYSRPALCVSSVRTNTKEGGRELFSRIIYQNISGFHRDAPMNILNALSFDEGTRVNKTRRYSFHRNVPFPF
ncbi:hypothetical protein CDAR_165301 [Caerostris darwini]|uniref:Uncharacterized protein n=1 Tax=Caerostris darwini TaxID=1538125 RepID=A0AAV4NYF4_9ARAC|nr:hypothetical protein CDAR_165301 [Caerostris darwini]